MTIHTPVVIHPGAFTEVIERSWLCLRRAGRTAGGSHRALLMDGAQLTPRRHQSLNADGSLFRRAGWSLLMSCAIALMRSVAASPSVRRFGPIRTASLWTLVFGWRLVRQARDVPDELGRTRAHHGTAHRVTTSLVFLRGAFAAGTGVPCVAMEPYLLDNVHTWPQAGQR